MSGIGGGGARGYTSAMGPLLRLFAAGLLVASPTIALAQTVAPPAAPPVEVRLTPDEIAAAQAEGASRNRAADLLAATRGDTRLALPAERRRNVHGEAGFGIGSNGAREVFGAVTTDIGDDATATVAGDYTQYGRQRPR